MKSRQFAVDAAQEPVSDSAASASSPTPTPIRNSNFSSNCSLSSNFSFSFTIDIGSGFSSLPSPFKAKLVLSAILENCILQSVDKGEQARVDGRRAGRGG